MMINFSELHERDALAMLAHTEALLGSKAPAEARRVFAEVMQRPAPVTDVKAYAAKLEHVAAEAERVIAANPVPVTPAPVNRPIKTFTAAQFAKAAPVDPAPVPGWASAYVRNAHLVNVAKGK